LFEVAVDFEAYVRELADPGTPLSVSHLVRLSQLGAEQLSALGMVWREMELRQRQRIVEELVELAEDNVDLNFDAVFMLALGDLDPAVRRVAISGLWEHDGADLIDPLIRLLQHDPDVEVRAEAALALGRFVVQGEFGRMRDGDMERVDIALRQVILDTTDAADVRRRALEALGARSETWVHDLIEGGFDSPERPLRLGAIHAMGRSCDPNWLSDLLPELASDDPEIRFEAANALGAIGDEGATADLVALLDDDDIEVAEASVSALGEIGGAEARDALETLAASDNERLRDAALEALASLDFVDAPLDLAQYR
jgi:HEAT repeat protein